MWAASWLEFPAIAALFPDRASLAAGAVRHHSRGLVSSVPRALQPPIRFGCSYKGKSASAAEPFRLCDSNERADTL
jgi:hypothetical protein